MEIPENFMEVVDSENKVVYLNTDLIVLLSYDGHTILATYPNGSTVAYTELNSGDN